MKRKKRMYEGEIVNIKDLNLFKDEQGKVHVLHCNCISPTHWKVWWASNVEGSYPAEGTCEKCRMHPWYLGSVIRPCQGSTMIRPGTPVHREVIDNIINGVERC